MFTLNDLPSMLKANFPIISISTAASSESSTTPMELIKIISDLNKESPMPFTVYAWDLKTGVSLVQYNADSGIRYVECDLAVKGDPVLGMLDLIEECEGRAVFLMFDLHCFLYGDRQDLVVVRAVKNLARSLRQTFKRLVLIGQNITIPDEFVGLIYELDDPLPTAEQLDKHATVVIEDLKSAFNSSGKPFPIELDDSDRGALVRAAQGLTQTEMQDALKLAAVRYRCIDSKSIETISQLKYNKLKRLNVEFSAPPDVPVQGLKYLQSWVERNTSLFSEEAKAYNLPAPKGIVLVGPPGTGKTLAAKSISQKWSIPSLTVDVGSLFSSLVGDSERNLRQLLKTAEAIAPAILLIDEIEKAFAGMATGDGDSGTSRRMFGHFLTWMNEHTAPVFVVASANSVKGLPPELLRKGRFDEVFFVGLPNLIDRASIMATHLSKYKVRIDEQGYIDRRGLFELAKLTLKYSGAELAAVIKDAAAAAFYAGRAGRVTYEDIYQEIVSFKPLAIREAAQFTELLEWARSAKPAAEPVEEKPTERSSVLI